MKQTGKQTGFDHALRTESIRAMEYGAFYAQFVIATGALGATVVGYFTGVAWMSIFPLLVFLVGSIFICTLIYLIARQGDGANIFILYSGLFLLVCSPSIFLIVVGFVVEGATAALYVGPMAMGHYPLLAITGLLFNLRFSVICGIGSGLFHLIAYVLAVNELNLVQSENAELVRILSQTGPNTMRAMILVLTGFMVGVVSRYARRLLSQIVSEQTENDRINRIFGEYVSDEVREKVTHKTLSMAGQRIHAVVLFSDIRGFTSLSEQMEPEPLVSQLNEYFDAMVEVIIRNRGVVDKFIGDALMVTFGAVIELDNPCANALKAAREMRAALEELNAGFRERGVPEIKIGIGMHYAEVMRGVIGSKKRKEYTVIGDGVNIAARLESITKKIGDGILFSEEFYQGLGQDSPEAPNIKKLGRLRLRGRSAETRIYTIQPTPVDTTRAGVPSVALPPKPT